MKENIVYDGEVIIVLEGVDNFRDEETKEESSLKFWLPKTFPDRVRFIITASPNSKSQEYLKGLGCDVLKINSDVKVIREWMEKTQLKRVTIAEQKYLTKIYEIIDSKITEKTAKMIVVKALLNIFAPSPADRKEQISKERALHSAILDKLDFEKLSSRFI